MGSGLQGGPRCAVKENNVQQIQAEGRKVSVCLSCPVRAICVLLAAEPLSDGLQLWLCHLCWGAKWCSKSPLPLLPAACERWSLGVLFASLKYILGIPQVPLGVWSFSVLAAALCSVVVPRRRLGGPPSALAPLCIQLGRESGRCSYSSCEGEHWIF